MMWCTGCVSYSSNMFVCLASACQCGSADVRNTAVLQNELALLTAAAPQHVHEHGDNCTSRLLTSKVSMYSAQPLRF